MERDNRSCALSLEPNIGACSAATSFDGVLPLAFNSSIGESFGGGSQPCEGDKCARYKLDVAIREEIANMQER